MTPAIDLQLLRALCAIVETRSVSRAADVLGITQPATSYLLGRLRSLLNDPLFVKTNKGMDPTRRALTIYKDVRRGLDVIDCALSPAAFDPLRSDRIFRLAMSDIGEMIFLPPIISHLQSSSPRVGIEIVQMPNNQLPRALDLGDVDFAIGNLPEICAETTYKTVFREHYVCLLARDHSTIRTKLSVAQLANADHIIVSSGLVAHHSVESCLIEQGIDRRAALKTANYTSVSNVVAHTDLLLITPSRVARALETASGLRSLPLPIRIPPFDVRVHWSARHETNEGHHWMRELLVHLVSRP